MFNYLPCDVQGPIAARPTITSLLEATVGPNSFGGLNQVRLSRRIKATRICRLWLKRITVLIGEWGAACGRV